MVDFDPDAQEPNLVGLDHGNDLDSDDEDAGINCDLGPLDSLGDAENEIQFEDIQIGGRPLSETEKDFAQICVDIRLTETQADKMI